MSLVESVELHIHASEHLRFLLDIFVAETQRCLPFRYCVGMLLEISVGIAVAICMILAAGMCFATVVSFSA